MTGANPSKIRADLARGHILLGELEIAHACLARVVADAPDLLGLDELLDALVEACRETGSPLLDTALQLSQEWAEALTGAPHAAQARPSRPGARTEAAPPTRAAPPRTPEPGQEPAPEPAARATERPDPRAAGIARLEAWRARVKRRYQGERAHDVP